MRKTVRQRQEALLQYLHGKTMEQREAFAERCNTTHGQLMQVAFGSRSCSAELAVAIDKETQGRVRMEVLHPTVDWPYVRRVMRSRKREVGERASA